MSRWWYFHREDDDLLLASNSDFDQRPIDAISSNNNPHTPYYREYDHADDSHVHVFAKTYETALILAKDLVD